MYAKYVDMIDQYQNTIKRIYNEDVSFQDGITVH